MLGHVKEVILLLIIIIKKNNNSNIDYVKTKRLILYPETIREDRILLTTLCLCFICFYFCLVLFLFVLFCFLSFNTACAAGFVQFGNSCYQFPGGTKNWKNAMSECKALTPSSHIVVVNDAAEAEFVLDQFSDDVHFWMGCKDDVDENYWLCEE